MNACGLKRWVSTNSDKGQDSIPFRLKCLVKVLPHPGTGQAKFASVFLRLSLASAVAVVVTFCLVTATCPSPLGLMGLPFRVDPMLDRLPPAPSC